MSGYDFAVENEAPGVCGKCSGKGVYAWGPIVNGKVTNSGTCWSCRGTGKQDAVQIARNRCYNRHKVIPM
jgi:DnaJ-class molecular chaperone